MDKYKDIKKKCKEYKRVESFVLIARTIKHHELNDFDDMFKEFVKSLSDKCDEIMKGKENEKVSTEGN